MQFLYTERFRRSYADASRSIQKRCDKQLAFLAQDLRHPSLKAKKYDAARDIWQARVSDDWRFYFMIRGDLYYLLDIIPHPK
jgi:hypothetical protein